MPLSPSETLIECSPEECVAKLSALPDRNSFGFLELVDVCLFFVFFFVFFRGWGVRCFVVLFFVYLLNVFWMCFVGFAVVVYVS